MSIFNTLFITDIHHIFEATFEKPTKFPMNNRTSYGICFASFGEVIYKHNGCKYICNKNQAVIIPKGSSYSIECYSQGSFPLINFLATDDFVLNEFVEIPLKNPNIYINLLSSLSAEFANKNATGYATTLCLLYKIIAELSREGETQTNTAISNIMDYINANFCNTDLNNSSLALLSNLSVSHFRSLFKSTYKTSPMNYIQTLRIGKAKQLLINSQYSVSQIADACGFSSLYSFSRAFKSTVGMSPSEYSKENRIYVI